MSASHLAPRIRHGATGINVRDTHAPSTWSPEVLGIPFAEARDGEQMQAPDVAPRAIDGTIHIMPGTLELPLFVQSIRPPHVVDALPALPDEDYPPGDYAFLTTTSVLYVNLADVWTVEDGSTITNGTLVAGLVRAGAIATEQLAADAVIANVVNVGGTVVINENGITIADESGAVAMTSAGFEGSWRRFLVAGLYNDDFSNYNGTGFQPMEFGDETGVPLPYWAFLKRSTTDLGITPFPSEAPVGRKIPQSNYVGAGDLDVEAYAAIAQGFVAVVPGRSYYARAYWGWLSATPSRPIRLKVWVDWYDVAGDLISSSEDESADQTTALGSQWDVLGRFTAPIEAVDAVIYYGWYWFNGIDDAAHTRGNLIQCVWHLAHHDHPEGSNGAVVIGDAEIVASGADLLLNGSLEAPDGYLGAARLRAYTTTDASLSSTEHGIQVGVDGGTNLIIDNNEIMVRNSGAIADMFVQIEGGRVQSPGWAGVVTTLLNDANMNDLNPANWDSYNIIRFTAFTAARTLTGLDARPEGTYIVIHNDTNFSLVIQHDNGATSAAANRFYCPDIANLTVRRRGSVMAVYLGSRWRVLAI